MSHSLPQTNGTIHLGGVQGEARIVRDRWGIPHIRASASADLFFAQGFVHAQDRLWHLEWDRRRAYGTSAELLGAPGVEGDTLMRRMQLERAARADWDLLNAETRAMLDAYAAGVNACIERTHTLPVEFTALNLRPAPWHPWDSLSIFKVRHVLMGVVFNKLWRLRVLLKLGADKARLLFPGYRDGQQLIVPPGAVYRERGLVDPVSRMEEAARLLPGAGGSNNWVVDGTRTLSGKPLLAGDPHRAIDVPNVYYQNQLTCDDFDAIGVSFPGVPAFSHLGHNRRVAWAVTHAQADYQDVYIERFDPQDPSRYEHKGAWHAAQVRTERIRVRGGADVQIQARRTLHGPVIEDGPWPHHALSLRYTAFEPGRTFETFLPALRARSVEELRAAQREWVDPAQNLIMADVDGNIGYHMRGHLPVRAASNGWLPAPGWDGAHEWTGRVPFEQLPSLLNPETHWIATANNKIVDDDYPHYLSADLPPGYRYGRIAQVLANLPQASVDDFAALQADRLSLFAQELVPHLLHAWHGAQLGPAEAGCAAALNYLRGWDFRMEPESVPATIFTVTRDALMRLLVEPLLGTAMADEMFGNTRGPASHGGRLRAFVPQWIAQNDTRLLDASDPARATWQAALQAALRRAIATLRERLGTNMSQWQWRRLHRTGAAHPLAPLPEVGARWNPVSAEYGGDADTVQAAGYYPTSGYTVGGTQVYRQIIDLADWSRSRWVVPLGASGHPDSPHFADQVPVWASNQYVPMWYEWSEIEANAEGRLVLKREG